MNKTQNRTWQVGSRIISDDSTPYVIAEIGHNHQGDLKKAEELFRAAKASGVDAVKLQKRDNASLFTKDFYNKPYDNENSFGKTYGEHREFLEFGHKEYMRLAEVARDLEMDFFATAFDFKSADFLADLEMPLYKLASGDLRNTPLLKHVAAIGKPMILSSGGAGIDDIRRALDVVGPYGVPICMLQCTATYPTEAEHMNLRVLTTLRAEFPELVVGLSDHYNGISMAVAAYVLGARVFEKHFTLNHTWKGTDHALSLEPIGMHKMVRDIQRCAVAMGSGEKVLLDIERPAITKMGKSLFAARDLPSGHILTEPDLAIKSPAGGIPPFERDGLLGRATNRALKADEIIALGDLTP